MSDTPTDRLSRARSEMDAAQLRLDADLSWFEHQELTEGEAAPSTLRSLLLATARHTRALRELFAATMEAHPPKRAVYVADGDGYRRLRTISRSRGETGLVAALDRLRDFAGTEQDVRLVAERLRELGSYEVAASLLRNVEG